LLPEGYLNSPKSDRIASARRHFILWAAAHKRKSIARDVIQNERVQEKSLKFANS
jgi:hypothetical protein